MRTAKAHASLRIRAVTPEPSLFAHIIYGARGSIKQRATSLILLDSCACVFAESPNALRYCPFSHETTHLLSGGNIVGKTNCEYLCMSGSSWTSCTGPVLNPYDTTRVAGGSSNGSAVLVCFYDSLFVI